MCLSLSICVVLFCVHKSETVTYLNLDSKVITVKMISEVKISKLVQRLLQVYLYNDSTSKSKYNYLYSEKNSTCYEFFIYYSCGNPYI